MENKICDKKMSFEECELAVLRSAIDKAEERDKSKAISPQIKEMIQIVEQFLRDERCICYGGTAINNLLPKREQFYNYDEEVPDYDFFSHKPIEHAKKLVDLYVKAGYEDVEAKSGVHFGTYKVYVNFIPMADITLLEKSLFDVLLENSIKKLGIYYCPPNYLRMSMYLELSRPKGDISRWEKVLKRLTLLNKYYPLKEDTCDYKIIQRKYEGDNKRVDEINEAIRTTCIDEECIFFGGYANFLYSKYMPYSIRSRFTKDPDYDILSKDPEKTSEFIKDALEELDIKNVKLIRHDGLQDIISEHYEIRVGKDSVCYVYKPIGCHSYNEITINKNTIKVATIDTMLSFYLAFMYINRPYYDPKRIVCMSKFLFDVQQNNRLKQNGLLKRFSIDCYGEQHTLEEIREQKAKKFQEFKKLKDRQSPEYQKWFFTYRPEIKKNTGNETGNDNNMNENKNTPEKNEDTKNKDTKNEKETDKKAKQTRKRKIKGKIKGKTKGKNKTDTVKKNLFDLFKS